MKTQACLRLFFCSALLAAVISALPARGQNIDLRGVWTGNAKGPVFGAKGTVTITHQQGQDISGIVEGGNLLGTAKFGIRGKVRGNMIYGSMDGNHFQGYVHTDGAIRGELRAIDGETYYVFLQRFNPYWGGVPYGATPYGIPNGMW
jgi:hypothetical protein